MSSGSSDTDVTEFAVMPCSSPSWTVVTTVTPVANWPMTLRNSIGSMRSQERQSLRNCSTSSVGCSLSARM